MPKYKKISNKKNFIQENLAELMDVSFNYIGMLEREEKLPSIETLIKLLNNLELSADMPLIGVISSGYNVKECMVQDTLGKLNPNERHKILDILYILIKIIAGVEKMSPPAIVFIFCFFIKLIEFSMNAFLLSFIHNYKFFNEDKR